MEFFYFITFFIFKFALIGSTLFLVMVSRTVLSVFILISAFILASAISIFFDIFPAPFFYCSISGLVWSFFFFIFGIFNVQCLFKYKDLAILGIILTFIAVMPPLFFLGEKLFLLRIFFQILLPTFSHLDWRVCCFLMVGCFYLFVLPFFLVGVGELPNLPLFGINAEEVGFPVRSNRGEIGFPIQYREWKTVERFPIHGTQVFFEMPVLKEACYPLFTITDYIHMGTGVSLKADQPLITPSFSDRIVEKSIPFGKEEEEEIELGDSSLGDYVDSKLSSVELDTLADVFRYRVLKLASSITSEDYKLFKGTYPPAILEESRFPISGTERQLLSFLYNSQNLSGLDWHAYVLEICRVVPVICKEGVPLDNYNNTTLIDASNGAIDPFDFILCLRMNPRFDSYVSKYFIPFVCREYAATHPDLGDGFRPVSELDVNRSALRQYINSTYYEPLLIPEPNPGFQVLLDKVTHTSRIVTIGFYDDIPHTSAKTMRFGDPYAELSEVEKVVLGFRVPTSYGRTPDPLFWGYYMELLRNSLRPVDFPGVLGPKRFADHLEFSRAFFQSKLSPVDFVAYMRKNSDIDELFAQVLLLELCYIQTFVPDDLGQLIEILSVAPI